MLFFFFFSSRRRHTRFDCDWSSDVCSSDLGFNPDMSARENIFMNAAMHGIPKHEVDQRLDQILDFAEIGEFLDSPLRYYSSGMYLRLAFSVAINMNPDILLADEILAVGDIAFQERCLQRVE